MVPLLLGTQVKEGERQGSWDPLGPHARTGGRVLSTALMAQTLEVYYRYHPVYWPR
jgi:hypothetical protein